MSSDLQTLYGQGGLLGGRGALLRWRTRHHDTPLRIITSIDLASLPSRFRSIDHSRSTVESEEHRVEPEKDADDDATDDGAPDDEVVDEESVNDEEKSDEELDSEESDSRAPLSQGRSAPSVRDNLILLEALRVKKNFGGEEGAEGEDDDDDDDELEEGELDEDLDMNESSSRRRHTGHGLGHAASHNAQPFWHHPCGRSVDLVVRRPPGLGGQPARVVSRRINKVLERVWRQLNMTVLHYRLQRFDKLYYQVVIGVNEDHYIPSWVPDKDDLPKLSLDEIKSGHKLAQELTQMHTQLQKFSVALEQISEDSRLEDPQRHSALSKTKNYVKMLLCEVEWALLSLAIPLPGAVPRDIMSADERNMTDDTNREIRDWGVLIKYRDFLRGWADVVAQAEHSRRLTQRADHGLHGQPEVARVVRSVAHALHHRR